MSTSSHSAIHSANRSDDVRRVWTALVVLGVALFANQYVTLSKVKRLLLERAPGDPVTSLMDKAWGIVAEGWHSVVGPADLVIAAAMLASAAYLVVAEARRGAVTAFMARLEHSRAALLGFLGLASVVIARSYLAPGQVFMGDSETHMLRSWMFADHFRLLQAPVWSNAWYGGFPLLEHYGPLYFVITALLTLALDDIHTATKLLLWGCHVGSVFAMYYFLREATRRTQPAIVGALAYALSFHRLHMILYQGDLQIAVLFLIYPVILLLTERFLRERVNARRTFVLITVLLSVLILNHHAYAFFGLVLLALYVVVRLAASPGTWRDRLAVLTLFGGAEVASLCISAFLLVPFLFGMDEHRGMPNSAFPFLIPNPWGPIVLLKLFRWSALGDGSSLGYVGLSIGALAAAGVVYAVRQRVPAAIALAVCALASLLMMRNRLAYNVKNVDFFMLFISALAAWALIAAHDRAVRVPAGFAGRMWLRWKDASSAHLAMIFIALMVADLGPTTFQSLYRENYDFKQPMYQRLTAQNEPFKVIERQVLTHDPTQPPGASFDANKLGIPSAYASTQTPLGFFHEGAGRSFGYNAEMVKALHRDLNQGRISDAAITGLYVMGVRYILFRDRYRWFTPELEPSAQFSVSEGALRLTHATPIIFSTRVISLADIEGYPSTDLIRERRYLEPETFDYSGRHYSELVLPVITTMGVDMKRGVSATLVAADAEARTDLGDAGMLRTEILSASVDLKRVDVRYRSNMAAIGHLPYTYFPYVQVEVDGQTVKAFRSAFSDVLLRVPAGEHVVSIRGVIPPLQARMLWVSAVALLLVLVAPQRLLGLAERHQETARTAAAI